MEAYSSIHTSRLATIYSLMLFVCFILVTDGILRILNVIGLSLSIATCTSALRSAIFSKRWNAFINWALFYVVIMEALFICNLKTDEWFASWGWAVFIFVFVVLMLFSGSFKEICVKNGRPAAYMAFAWVTLWTMLHFIKVPTDGFGHILAVCWYVFTAFTAITVTVGYVRHMAGCILPLAWFLCMMDIGFYQLLPYFTYGTPMFLSIPWAGQFWI